MIGLLTFHWADDYGAMLQAYALKHCLADLGGPAEVIPYAPLRLSGRYWWCPLWAKVLSDGRIRHWFNLQQWRYHAALGPAFWKRRLAMRAFRRKYLSSRPALRAASRIPLKQYSCVFVGSDQVWNPDITVGLDDAYIGNIPGQPPCRMVAYAASLGRNTLPEAYRKQFARHVGHAFSALSVREASAVPFLERLLHRPVGHLPDPVFLLGQEDWRPLLRLPAEKDYILLHTTEANQSMVQYASALARQWNKTLIQTSFPRRSEAGYGAQLRTSGGPAEFLGYIQNAACVVTDSFHATAFSVLFKKQFLVFRHSAYNSRLADLMETLGLQARIWDGGQPPEPERMWNAIDWAAVQGHIAEERTRAVQFINTNLQTFV